MGTARDLVSLRLAPTVSLVRARHTLLPIPFPLCSRLRRRRPRTLVTMTKRKTIVERQVIVVTSQHCQVKVG